MAKWQRVNIKLRKGLKPDQREAIGLEIIEHIRKRTLEGKDKRGNPWRGKAAVYSESYKNSLDFKQKQKRGHVDLDLSSEMLNSMKIISHKAGSIIIGYDKQDQALNGKVEGNRLGTYGSRKPRVGKKRDFLGIERAKLTEFQNEYTVKNKQELKEKIAKLKGVLKASAAGL